MRTSVQADTLMPFHIVEEPHFLRICFTGHMTSQDMAALLEALEAIEASSTLIKNRLTDLSLVEESKIEVVDLRSFAEARKKRRFANPFLSAIVAPHPANFGYARMFQVFNSHSAITIRVFADLASAEAWLTPNDQVP